MSKRSRYGWILGLFALSGCWDSVASPIRIAGDDGGGLGMDGGGDSDRDAAADEGGVPGTQYCALVADWPEAWAEAERALFGAINALRDRRPRCGNRSFDFELRPLRFVPELRCSARLHSVDLETRDDTDEPEPETPQERVAAAGFSAPWVSEAVVTGGTDHAQVLESLRRERCADLFDPRFRAVGIGLYKERWTLHFAGP